MFWMFIRVSDNSSYLKNYSPLTTVTENAISTIQDTVLLTQSVAFLSNPAWSALVREVLYVNNFSLLFCRNSRMLGRYNFLIHLLDWCCKYPLADCSETSWQRSWINSVFQPCHCFAICIWWKSGNTKYLQELFTRRKISLYEFSS